MKKKKTVSPDVERIALAFVLVACSIGRELVRSKHRAKLLYSPDPVAGPERKEHCLCGGRRLSLSPPNCLVFFNQSGDFALFSDVIPLDERRPTASSSSFFFFVLPPAHSKTQQDNVPRRGPPSGARPRDARSQLPRSRGCQSFHGEGGEDKALLLPLLFFQWSILLPPTKNGS